MLCFGCMRRDTVAVMRVGVLDIGSNTGHLLVVDAHDGAAPLPAYSFKQPLRLAQHLDEDGHVTPAGIDALTSFTAEALQVSEDKGCAELVSFATSAVRDAGNSQFVLDHVRERTGVGIEVLSGEDEARLTFLAARRWFGWSAGRLIVFDIGGGSLEIASGADERPDIAQSLPLGAARVAATLHSADAHGVPNEDVVRDLRRDIRATIASGAGQVLRVGSTHRAAATSKTFRSLARICGAAPSGDGILVPRTLALVDLREWIPKLMAMTPAELATLPGVSENRAHQIVPGALVAEACMDIFDEEQLEVCPWALREGVILDRLDKFGVTDKDADKDADGSADEPPELARPL